MTHNNGSNLMSQWSIVLKVSAVPDHDKVGVDFAKYIETSRCPRSLEIKLLYTNPLALNA